MNVRDYVFIDDVVELMIHAILKKRTGLYNVATGEGVSIRELAFKIIELSEMNLSPQFVPTDKPCPSYIFNIARLRKDFDFKPTFSLDRGLKEEIAWHKLRTHAREARTPVGRKTQPEVSR
jgi:nucleoside-diphosphate-sugar epimerase